MQSLSQKLGLLALLLLGGLLPLHADQKAGVRVPAGTATGQTLHWDNTAVGGMGGWVVDSALTSNGSQAAVGGSAGTGSRLSVSPQAAAENGVTVNLPASSTGTGLIINQPATAAGTGNLFGITVGGAAAAVYIDQFSNFISNKNVNANTITATNGFLGPGLTNAFADPTTLLTPQNSSSRALVVRGVASQSVNLQEWQSSVNAILAKIDQLGNATVGTLNCSTLITSSSAIIGNTASISTSSVSGVDLICKETSNGAAGDIIQALNPAATPMAKVTNGGAIVNYGSSTVLALSTPTAPTLTTSGTAGSTTYYYRITAVNQAGETLASTETSIATGNATLTGTNKVNLSWNLVSGAEKYNIYGRTTGTETKLAQVTALTYSDTGTTPSGALPTVNTTGYVNSPSYQVGGVTGLTVVVPLAKLTTGGTNGSETFTSGILTAVTPPT